MSNQLAMSWVMKEMEKIREKGNLEAENLIWAKGMEMEKDQIYDIALYHADSSVSHDCIHSYMKKKYNAQDEE